ncbi:MAG: phosphopantetheine-binding protein [Acidimicrobiales bacterium]
MNAHPAIQTSVVVGIGSSGAERRLVAYLVATSSERPSLHELETFLGEFLPAHMLPTRYGWLEELPLTPHGKVDRDALFVGLFTTIDQPVGRQAQTKTEMATASMVAELLGLKEVGADQNFFLLGGHSMLGAQLIVRLEDLFGVDLTLRFLFDHPTVAEISAQVELQTAAHQSDDAVSG